MLKRVEGRCWNGSCASPDERGATGAPNRTRTCGLRFRKWSQADPAAPDASRPFTSRGVTSTTTSPNVPTYPGHAGQFAALVLHGSEGLVSPKKAAERLGIKVSTVYSLCAKSALPCVRLGSLWRIDVEGFLAGRYRVRQ